MMTQSNNSFYPLVSIIVITYNSSDFVLETLQSVKEQTYRNLELIVSDDCSTDGTVEICRKWIEENKSRFCRIECLIADKNIGISSTCNRGLYIAKGDWLKFIAGDDLLHPNCIENLLNFVISNSEAKVIESEVQEFIETYHQNNFISYHSKNNLFHRFGITAKKQFEILLDGNCVNAVGTFINRQTLLEVNGFEEKYKYLDDYPIWLKLLKSDYKIFFLEKLTTYYRIHSSSITSTSAEKLFSNFYKSKRKVEVDMLFPHFSKKKGKYIIMNTIEKKL